jgi:hypothetical protein
LEAKYCWNEPAIGFGKFKEGADLSELNFAKLKAIFEQWFADPEKVFSAL